jgi:hypothetical protein
MGNLGSLDCVLSAARVLSVPWTAKSTRTVLLPMGTDSLGEKQGGLGSRQGRCGKQRALEAQLYCARGGALDDLTLVVVHCAIFPHGGDALGRCLQDTVLELWPLALRSVASATS